MPSSFFIAISIVFLSRLNTVACLNCYLCNSYDKQSPLRSDRNESCNILTPGKQLEICPKLGTHCFTICSIDRIRKLRYVRRGCTSHRNLCSRFSSSNTNEPGMEIKCNVCSYDNCNHLNSCMPEWTDNEDEYNDVISNRKYSNDKTSAVRTEDKISTLNDTSINMTTASVNLTLTSESNTSTLRIIVTDYPGQIIADYMNSSNYDYNGNYTSDFNLDWHPSTGNRLELQCLLIMVVLSVVACNFF
ncbi:hypothetical protein M8J76_006536 [Diaphorina citri]|nr:hypothetical protein M8J76_006536 [Diaphorina citri]